MKTTFTIDGNPIVVSRTHTVFEALMAYAKTLSFSQVESLRRARIEHSRHGRLYFNFRYTMSAGKNAWQGAAQTSGLDWTFAAELPEDVGIYWVAGTTRNGEPAVSLMLRDQRLAREGYEKFKKGDLSPDLIWGHQRIDVESCSWERGSPWRMTAYAKILKPEPPNYLPVERK